MKRVVIQYKLNPDQIDTNVDLLKTFYDELESTQPEGLGHAVLQLADGVTFIHIAEETDEAAGGVFSLETFQHFEAGIQDRCEIPPAVQPANVVGSYRLFTSSMPANAS